MQSKLLGRCILKAQTQTTSSYSRGFVCYCCTLLQRNTLHRGERLISVFKFMFIKTVLFSCFLLPTVYVYSLCCNAWFSFSLSISEIFVFANNAWRVYVQSRFQVSAKQHISKFILLTLCVYAGRCFETKKNVFSFEDSFLQIHGSGSLICLKKGSLEM